MAARLGFVLSFVVLGLILGLERSEGVTHTVGDSTGWGVPANSDFYDTWADGKNFTVGDILSFTWSGLHDVAIVNEAQHDACTPVTTNVFRTSPAAIPLNTTGRHYFICTISNHCTRGQELDIDVLAAATTTPTTPGSATPPTSTSTPTTPTGSASPPPPPPPNSSASFGPVVALSALFSIIAFSFLS